MENFNQDTYINIIKSIASVAASQVDGVASISHEAGSILNRLNFKNKNSAIEVEIIGELQVIISLSINAYYGYRVPQITCELQDLIKNEVEKTTFYKVKSVNVHVVGIVFPS